jgi:hypothetical protein
MRDLANRAEAALAEEPHIEPSPEFRCDGTVRDRFDSLHSFSPALRNQNFRSG